MRTSYSRSDNAMDEKKPDQQTSGQQTPAIHSRTSGEGRQPAITLSLGHDELVIRGRYETLSIVNDLLIAVWFLIGSILFFFEYTVTLGTWLFVLGSAQLLLRPAIRLTRRVHLRRIGTHHGHETARDLRVQLCRACVRRPA